ncbi:nitronate monooxygenase [Salinibacter ruber]|uniref:Nitronate monooxygenase n=3 Tax=Salinibacter ruber TaxID=146919 RepID=A0AAW5PBR7_9BACT|nr:nitronate monooxygenase [Salinibacter ruber]MCS3629197.1 nitronate monooxygenase [Salinibacter ruber]MCS3826685.1 nitronate monooxygenase [Salinibacter ruber]MCS4146105.1 nitronate monooxygenase [Salinibacter ruber]MCS4158914.1 nitronate monooxygenase [Salinibacter ruber]MCS4223036.1 nitronate monooxygenase [Salinibacter ruber]
MQLSFTLYRIIQAAQPSGLFSMLNTSLCDLLGVRLPIIQAPIGSASCPALVAAVSNAGGLGMLAVTWRSIDETRQAIRETKQRTDRPFGVNIVLEWPQKERLEVCLEEGAEVVSLFWGEPAELTSLAHDAGALVMNTVSSAAEAEAAAAAGADVLVAQGWEAGGHVPGEVSTLALTPRVVDVADGVPVVAAGGIADGRGVAAALALGASGAMLGTRFLTSAEASVHAEYKQRVVGASETDTAHGVIFDGGWPDAPHRVLRNRTVKEWEEAGCPTSGSRPGEGEVVATGANGTPVRRYDDAIPTLDVEGNAEDLALYAGQSSGLVCDVMPAKEIVKELASEAEEALHRTSTLGSQEKDAL